STYQTGWVPVPPAHIECRFMLINELDAECHRETDSEAVEEPCPKPHPRRANESPKKTADQPADEAVHTSARGPDAHANSETDRKCASQPIRASDPQVGRQPSEKSTEKSADEATGKTLDKC